MSSNSCRRREGVNFGEAFDMLATKAGITLVRDPAEAETSRQTQMTLSRRCVEPSTCTTSGSRSRRKRSPPRAYLQQAWL